MPDNNTNTMVDFGTPEKENTIIKAIGVGGGGGNCHSEVMLWLTSSDLKPYMQTTFTAT